MATKKSAESEPESTSKGEKSSEGEKDPRGHDTVIEERRKRREDATTVDGTESFPPEPPATPEVKVQDAPVGKE